MKKTKYNDPPCFRCWLESNQCPAGTIPGACIDCGTHRRKGSLSAPIDFITQGLIHFLLGLAQSISYLSLGPESSYYRILEVQTQTEKGVRNGIFSFNIHGNFHPSNLDLCWQMDNMVMLHHTPNIGWLNTTSTIISSALLARGYLTLMFADTVKQQSKSFEHGRYRYDKVYDINLSLHMINFILPRVDTLITEVMSAVRQQRNGDEIVWKADVSAATAVLYTGFMDLRKRLSRGTLDPLCGDKRFSCLLHDRLKEMLNELDWYWGRGCERGWASLLDGELENLRTNVHINKITLTIETRSYATSTPTTSQSTPSSMLFDLATPSSSGSHLSPPVTDKDLPILQPAWNPSQSGTSYDQSSSGFYPQSDATAQMTTQVSDPTGSNQWTNWSEQNNVYTWRH